MNVRSLCLASFARQRGSALLLALIFMAVLARMALSAVDAALLGTSLALNYRNHDRVFHGAEAMLMALDTALLTHIQTGGLQVTLDSLPTTAIAIGVPAEIRQDAGIDLLRYQVYAGETGFATTAPAPSAARVCGLLYRLVAQATGVRPGTRVKLSLQRHACCVDWQACESGDFESLSRVWRRLQ